MDTFIELHQKFEALSPNFRKDALLFIEFLIEKSRKSNQQTNRTFGSAKGKIHMSEDFDEPLTEFFEEYM